MTEPRIALLGFLPWVDVARDRNVRENPSAIAAELCARELAGEGRAATFVPVAVSGEGINEAMEVVRLLSADVVVALGQTGARDPTPRVETQGIVPGAWAPASEDEPKPWPLAPDAEVLVAKLNELTIAEAETAPFRTSDDPGGYFCDHLCVELVREARRRPLQARFLHVTPIDGCSPEVRDGRIRQYVRQTRATVEWLLRLCGASR
jgi:pyrrolidone-carboxylate peptidase